MNKRMILVASILLVSAVVMAEEEKAKGTIPDGLAKMELTPPNRPIEADETGEQISADRREREIQELYATRNRVMIMALWTATVLDIQSSMRLDNTRYREVNCLGHPAGQILTSAAATGAAFLIQRYADRRLRWLAQALLGGATAGHTLGAMHNYSLK